MRLKNTVLFIAPLLIAVLLSAAVGTGGPAMVLAFFIIFDALISTISSFIFITYWKKSKSYEKFLRDYLSRDGAAGNLAVVIPIYNESPWTVVQTAIAAKMAIEDKGDVYVLDDSSKEDIRAQIDEYSRQYGFTVFRREDREGYKAGAVNAWLKKIGRNYDYVMILDADQRPLPGLAATVLKAFKDPKTAFVQVPQYYSKVDNSLSMGAHLQLIPFLRVVMRARHINGSAFSLGSGTVFRVSHLLEVGGLYEKTVTEDIYTSILLHERGYRSEYLDVPLVWYGEAPLDLHGFWIQQNRWSMGGFQLIGKLLGARLSTKKLVDYLMGVFYWLHVGPLTVVDIAAPVLFLLFGIHFMSLNPAFYLAVYGSVFAFTFIFYILSMRRYRYGFREYMYHQSIQLVASMPVTMAFLQWLTGRKKGFAVTPKSRPRRGLGKAHMYLLSIFVVLLVSTVVGLLHIIYGASATRYAYMVNTFWASWWMFFSASALYVSLARPVSDKMKSRVRQSYEGMEQRLVDMLSCGAELESTVGRYYMDLSKQYHEFREDLEKLGRESFRHAETYLRIMSSVRGNTARSSCHSLRDYISMLSDYRDSCVGKQLRECLLRQEELVMYVFAQEILESLGQVPESLLDEVRKIMEDELEHDAIIRRLCGNSKSRISPETSART